MTPQKNCRIGAGGIVRIGPAESRERCSAAMYPVYLRAEAFRAAKQGKESALAEYQKILDHRV